MAQVNSMEDVQARIEQWLRAYGGAEISLGELLCDRYAREPERMALHYEDASGKKRSLSFSALRDRSTRFAGVLRDLGLARGDRVATLLPKSPELMIATVALWRLGAVHVPLFTAFGPQAIAYRLENSGATLIITDPANRSKVGGDASVRIISVEDAGGKAGAPGDTPFWAALEAGTPIQSSATVSGADLLILLYTSGTTGNPKGVEVPVKALASFEAYMRFGLDVRDEDVYWNVADPGWAYGLYYGLVGSLLLGKANIYYNAPFDPAAVYRILEEYRVTNFAAAPTAYRSLRAAGEVPGLKHRLRLRVASSAGEPLNPEVISWAQERLGVPIHDQYGQTELGMIVINHHLPALERPIRPGSMGHPTPGFRVVIVDQDGRELEPGQEGELAIDTKNSPLCWFRGYYKDPQRTAERYTADGRYNLTGDAASRDSDGYIFFSGRVDDIISSAGYRIGPFEIESTLMQHRAVAEAAVVGKPDELRGEVVKAYVVLKPGYDPSAALADELSQFVKSLLAAHVYPREVEFIDQLPKTPSGKIQRFLLRTQNR